MAEREMKPPSWGPTTDPAPWHGHWPWPDPIPWIWKRIPFPDPGDPIPFPYKILEQIQIQDVIALRLASLEAVNQVFQAQLKAERALLEKQQEILGKYK